MEQRNNFSLFAQINDVPYQYPWLCSDETCDVLVIGGGITGILCMNQLANMGIDTVLVSQKPIGFSSACTSSSILEYQSETMLTELSDVIGKDEAFAYFNSCEEALADIENMSNKLENFNFIKRDSFLFTNSQTSANHLHAEYLMRRHNGIQVEFLEKADARNLFSFELEAGILAKNSAGEVDGYLMCHSIAQECINLGARIYENTAVTEIDNLDSGIIISTAYGRKIAAKKVILAIGKNQETFLDYNVSIKTSFTLASSPVQDFSGYTSKAIVKDIDNDVYLRTTKDNRIIIGGLDCSLLDKEGKLAKVIGINRIVERKYKELETILSDMLIAIDPLHIEYQYTSEYGKTNSGMPLFGERKEYPNIFFAMPSSVNGILQSQVIAKKIAFRIKDDFEDIKFD